eukprot:428419_1
MPLTKAEVIEDLRNDGFPHVSDVYYNKCENTGQVIWISLPNIWNINREQSYYYVLHHHSGKTEHISASKIINSNPKYKMFLKNKMGEQDDKFASMIKDTFKISKQDKKKKKIKKMLKKKKKTWKKKYLKKGQKRAYRKVFAENMKFLGKRMSSRLNNKSIGQNKTVRQQISPTLMRKYGNKKLAISSHNKQKVHGIFGASNFKKQDKLKGSFKVYNLSQKYRSNSKWFSLNFNVKHKPKGRSFYSYENGIGT